MDYIQWYYIETLYIWNYYKVKSLGKGKKYPLLEGLEIVDIGAGGRSLAKYEDIVVFVNKSIPGDRVDIQIYRNKKKL